ncbi:O-antigen polymerase [Cecembia rubra]|uniref:Oligosaccharide repeat unit polymerase n=1 Tax=Cecembia rubra TaxID=1485585 RepID=A0A2P8EA19_9BACT|nr:O-antigen polymerase [Cecembia rubra]PSL06308.1 oligosaccharide repeat unit polymerase [Cecembia rubra]
MADNNVISNIWLIFFVLIWFLTFAVYQIRKKSIDAGSIILLSYFFYAIVSLLLFNNPYYQFNPIELFPFVYLYLLLMLAFSPVLKFDAKKIRYIQKPPDLYLNTLIYILIIFSVIQLPSIFSDFSKSIIRLLFVSSGGQDLYNEAMAESKSLGDGNISNLPSIITNAYGNVGILLFFYYLTLKDRKFIVTLGLFLSFMVNILNNISLGQRGPLVEILMSIFVSYFAFKEFIQPNLVRLIKFSGFVFLVVSLVPILILTTSRFGDSRAGSNSSVYFYLGQQNLYFNNHGLDNGGIRYGDRTFPFFKKLLGFENVPDNFWERRDKYPELKINDEVFIGFVGDFTLDFGPFLVPFMFLLFFVFILYATKTKNGVLYFHQLILIHFVISLCMLGGIKLYPFSDLGGNLQLIVYFFLYVFFRLDHEFRFKQKVLNIQD